jgi:streptogramin lyase
MFFLDVLAGMLHPPVLRGRASCRGSGPRRRPAALALEALEHRLCLSVDLLVGSNRTDSILRYDGTTGDFLGAFVASGSGGLMHPGGFAFGPDGNLYVSSNATDSVLRYDGATGEFIDCFAWGGGLVKPSGLTFGPDGNLYVNSNGTNAVLRYNGSTGEFIDVFASGGGLDHPSVGILFGPDGNLYVNSSRTDSVLRYDGVTGAFLDAFVPEGSGDLVEPSGLAFGPDGNLYVAAHAPMAGAGKVFRYDGTTGDFIDEFVTQGSGEIGNPTSLAFGPDGNLYVDSRRNSRVLRFDGTTGDFLDTFVAQGSGGLNAPNRLLFHDFAAGPSAQSHGRDVARTDLVAVVAFAGATPQPHVTVAVASALPERAAPPPVTSGPDSFARRQSAPAGEAGPERARVLDRVFAQLDRGLLDDPLVQDLALVV